MRSIGAAASAALRAVSRRFAGRGYSVDHVFVQDAHLLTEFVNAIVQMSPQLILPGLESVQPRVNPVESRVDLIKPLV